MARERGEPAILDTSKPIIEPPVFPDYPQNTQQTRSVADDPDLVSKEDDEEDEDEDLDEDLDESVNDEFDEDVTDVAEPTVFKDEEFLDEDDEEDDF
ncbi:hypothetical protein [Dyadobacter sandarakinus]|uniref:Uncharacterized protein n=1 Tax=Dyadobacter sandarakinus TaxID=2747268 RepID=A0ABX7I4Q0_9BACT|nr:hypothetical protein [Dyadobacter sandarakinus]QRR01052.1 hypothetical protein HWI92_09120 [Dyadobacter sandarakinus]